jgi:hypothetical protein
LSPDNISFDTTVVSRDSLTPVSEGGPSYELEDNLD